MRRSIRELRIKLFERGNNRCPICLSDFTRESVEKGEIVTLEHVPPKALGSESRGRCLTCVACNQDAGGGIDQAAGLLCKPPTVTVEIKGWKHTGTLEHEADGTFTIKAPPLRGSLTGSDVLSDLGGGEFKATITFPNEHFAIVSWLKSAYLCLFSLLGEQGYRYAEGSVGHIIRRQIMNPSKRIITKCIGNPSDNWSLESGVYMHVEQPQLWLVQMENVIVVLPKTGDVSFYRDSDIFQARNRFHLRKWYGWKLASFGKSYVGSAQIDDRSKVDEAIREDLFGLPTRVVQGERKTHAVIADHGDDFLTLLQIPPTD